ncbi:MAG: 4-oxalomesaconate tautomerase, partial [Rhodospirillaceae bacterium]|nr:4-oxalomesaconate tautomerase [Rhodospirillaceae bacterium]
MSDEIPGGVRCLWMRGGTSKGGYFLADDLPADPAARDAFLRRVMGSPDPRQIDGIGGADPLTSKVAVVSPSERAGVDVDYLFLQVSVDAPLVSDAQTCGNILAGVGPFAIERGLVPARDGETPVTIHLVNTGQTAVATVQTPGGTVRYAGDARIDGVPGAAAPVPLQFRDTAGATCGALLPTGRPLDRVDGIEVTLIDNGMPCVVLRAADAGIAGTESRDALDADAGLKLRLERLRLACGPLMNLGNVVAKTVPKMTMVSAPQHGGAIATRTFIPHRCHATIGVLGAVSVATACLLPGSPAAALAALPPDNPKT